MAISTEKLLTLQQFQTAADAVFLWAASKPAAAITVQIECRKAVGS